MLHNTSHTSMIEHCKLNNTLSETCSFTLFSVCVCL